MTRNRRCAVVAAVMGFALALPAQAAAGYADGVLADAPLTYLRLGEAPGATVAHDASPNHRDGAYAGAPVLGVAGPFTDAGTAVRLAAGDAVTASVGASSGSVELWVNPNRLANGQQAGLVAHGDPAGDGWALGIGARRKLAWVGGGGAVSSKLTLSAGTWTLLTVAWTQSKVHLYRNGALVKSLNRTGPTPVSGNAALVVGSNGAGAFTGSFAGKVDEVALFAQELTAADAQAHFAAAQVPVNTAPPTIAGAPTIGTALTAQPGAWGDGGTATYQWQRCAADGEDCDDITGATGSTYVVTADDACRTIQVAVTMTNQSGAATSISTATSAVPGTCPDPGTGGGSGTGGGGGTGSGPAPLPTPTPTPTTTTPIGAGPTAVPGPTGARCLKLLPGRRTRKLRRLGTVRLRATANRCLTTPLAATFTARRGVKLKSIRYALDGRRLGRTRRRARLAPAALRAGTHKLTVVVRPRGGRAKRAVLRLRVALG